MLIQTAKMSANADYILRPYNLFIIIIIISIHAFPICKVHEYRVSLAFFNPKNSLPLLLNTVQHLIVEGEIQR